MNKLILKKNTAFNLLVLACYLFLFDSFSHAKSLDKVLVIVNEDIITQKEFDYRKRSVLSDMQLNAGELPKDLNKQLLDSMVSDLLQLQEAQRRGISVSEQELDSAMVRFASQQKMTLEQLQTSLSNRGDDIKKFRETVKHSLIISRLSDFYARARVVVPDYEVDGFIEQNNMQDAGAEYLIAHILIKNPDQNSALAQQAIAELRQGVDFSQVAAKYSQATDAPSGGVMGWRTQAQLPDIYYDALKDLSAGQVTDILRSPNALHILKLVDFKGTREKIIQHKIRHILVSADTQIARERAFKKLNQLRDEIAAGTDFSVVARIHSDDSVSAALGGDLDWVSPGQTVPEFEKTMMAMNLNQLSTPFNTQYGVHILQVTERREKNITQEMIRFKARDYLRRKRAEREFQQWVRELKEQAFIQHVSPPL